MPPKLTSKNLFDAVFSLIPADVVLDVGPSSFKEQMVLRTSTEDWQREEEGEEETGRANTLSENAGGITTASATSIGIFGTPTTTTTTTAIGGAKRSSIPVLEVEMDMEDTAIQVATVDAVRAPSPPPEVSPTTAEEEASKTGAAADQEAMGGRPVSSRAITAEDQLRLLPPGQRTVHEGQCATFRVQKGFGFVTPDVGGPDIYFTQHSLLYGFTQLVLTTYYQQQGKEIPPVLREMAAAAAAAETVEGEGDGTSSEKEKPLHEGEEPVKEEREEGEEEGGAVDLLPPLDTPAEEISQCMPIPTDEEKEAAKAAAALLDDERAQLLAWGVEHGQPIVHVRDRLSFTVHRNRLSRNSRLLRAEHIRGEAASFYALPTEQCWFFPLFEGRQSPAKGRGVALTAIVGCKTQGGKGETTVEAEDPSTTAAAPSPEASVPSKEGAGAGVLTRYTGVIRRYDPIERRGYIQCDEPDADDVLFQEPSVLWDTQEVPPGARQLKERLRVAYSVGGRDKHGKYIATLITNENNTLLTPSTAVYIEETVTRGRAAAGGRTNLRGSRRDNANLKNSNNNNSNNNNNNNLGHHNNNNNMEEVEEDNRKRPREEEDVFLFGEDDYAMM